jgi:hypothetical protein
MKLKKVSNAYWAGNGFGTETAEWVVADCPDIRIVKLGSFWVAIRGEGAGAERLATGATRKDCAEVLSYKTTA